jgi:hypothetical protein
MRLTVVLLFAGLAMAQYGPPGGPYQPDRVMALVDRVHQDLNHGYDVWHLNHGERDRLNHAEKELREFAEHRRHGRFDQGNLDKNHLKGGERDALWADVEELRHMREAYDRHEIGRW